MKRREQTVGDVTVSVCGNKGQGYVVTIYHPWKITRHKYGDELSAVDRYEDIIEQRARLIAKQAMGLTT